MRKAMEALAATARNLDRKTLIAIGTAALALLVIGWQWTRARAVEQTRQHLLAQLDPAQGQDNGAAPNRSGRQGRGGWRQRAANRPVGAPAWQGNSPVGGGATWRQRPQMSDAERQARQTQRLDAMARDLHLSDPQKQQVQSLFESMRQQRQALSQSSTPLTREQRMEERMRGRVEMQYHLSQILSPQQMNEWKTLEQQRRQQWQSRGGNGA